METLTPKQVARAIGVSDASMKRWCDKGVIPSVRTVGGHRRISISAVFSFLRETGRALVRPELLGLSPTSCTGTTVVGRSVEQATEALALGDESRFQRIIFDLYAAGQKVREIGDRTVAPALCRIGEKWKHGAVEIYQERRAVEICVRTLHRLECALPPPRESAPLAIGGTPSLDPYSVATVLVELTLRELGWRAESLGCGLPGATLRAALENLKPRVIWLSVSTAADTDAFLAEYQPVFDAAIARGTAVVVGGRRLDAGMRSRMQYSAYCDNLAHVEAFAGALTATRAAPQSALG
jgi:excisionase family DNA binding protein